MKTSNTEVAAVSKAEAPEYGLRTLVRSAEAGTQEQQAYRAKLDEIHAAALEIQRKRGTR